MSKQEFIAKIRYENDLPPPMLPPKLFRYEQNPDEDVASGKLLTSIYAKTNVTPLINVDNDLGMPLDLLTVPGVLNEQNLSGLYGYENIKLEQKDRVLLRDPGMDKVVKADLSKVTFLRRTEYVSDTTAAKFEKLKRPYSRVREEEVLTSKQVLEKVENTFSQVGDDLSSLHHPIKKKLKAVKSWNLLPDTVSMDQGFFTIKMVGSAALDKNEKDSVDMSSALFRPVELEEDEWISVYNTDKESSSTFKKNFEEQIDELSHDDHIYKYKRLRDFDMRQLQPESQLSELSLSFNDEKGIVFYKPLRSRLELRRRRVNDALKPLVREHTWDQINVKLRAPTTQETKFRDAVRMRYDPIDFPALDEDEDEVEEEQSELSGKDPVTKSDQRVSDLVDAETDGYEEQDSKNNEESLSHSNGETLNEET